MKRSSCFRAPPTRAPPARAPLSSRCRSLPRDLEGQDVAIIGLGKSGVSAARLALLRGARSVAGLDVKTDTAPLEARPELEGLDRSRVRTLLGPHDRKLLLESSRVVLSPGIPLSQPDVAAALALSDNHAARPKVVSELSFAAECLSAARGPAMTAVTGTNGKSTVATFAGQLLAACGVPTWVGGNLGTPLSDLVASLASGDGQASGFEAAVVEVSSYQVDLSPATPSFRPRSAAALNLTQDHLERHVTMQRYADAKARLFKGLDLSCGGGTAILPAQGWAEGAGELRRAWEGEAGGRGRLAVLGAGMGEPGCSVQRDAGGRATRLNVSLPWLESPSLASPFSLDLAPFTPLGSHNAANLAAAVLLVAGLGDLGGRVQPKTLQAGLARLRPPPHRIEFLGTLEGVRWVNDSKATNVDSTEVALKAMWEAGLGAGGDAGGAGPKCVVLLGGLAKLSKSEGGGLGMQRLTPLLLRVARAAVSYGQDGDEIAAELEAAGLGAAVKIVRRAGFEEAVSAAQALARPGDTLLLSPACASFDQFRNFEHRGDSLRELLEERGGEGAGQGVGAREAAERAAR